MFICKTILTGVFTLMILPLAAAGVQENWDAVAKVESVVGHDYFDILIRTLPKCTLDYALEFALLNRGPWANLTSELDQLVDHYKQATDVIKKLNPSDFDIFDSGNARTKTAKALLTSYQFSNGILMPLMKGKARLTKQIPFVQPPILQRLKALKEVLVPLTETVESLILRNSDIQTYVKEEGNKLRTSVDPAIKAWEKNLIVKAKRFVA
ncbi:hypothetical protein TWF694_004450 [Orbilia ellipsospora]|uniref:Uncharacterized protein n=1 Tax=Orbilia ellipsospora TaxID=2528407 RepID=A0AAV9WV53_9PEZI